jgi:hypothetical protein
MSTPDANPIHYVSVLTQYLSPSLGARNTDVILAELLDFIERSPRERHILTNLLMLGREDLLRAYLARHGEAALRDSCDSDGDPISPWYRFRFESIPACGRPGFFDLLFDILGEDRTDLARLVAVPAAKSGDVALFERFLHRVDPGPDGLDRLLTRKGFIEEAHPDLAPRLAGIIEDWCTRIPDDEFLRDTLRRSNMRTTAVLMKLRIVRSAQLEQFAPRDRDAANGRLLSRLQASSHAELEIYAELPDIEGILRMSSQEVSRMLAGPSPAEQRAEEKQRLHDEKIARARAYFAAKGEPSPV